MQGLDTMQARYHAGFRYHAGQVRCRDMLGKTEKQIAQEVGELQSQVQVNVSCQLTGTRAV
jgi:hypothetical protein